MFHSRSAKYLMLLAFCAFPTLEVKAKGTEAYFYYETSFKPPMDMLRVLRGFMHSTKGFAEACQASWEKTNYGFTAGCEDKGRKIQGVLFSNGYFRLMSTYPERTSAGPLKDFPDRVAAITALDVAATTGVFPPDDVKACRLKLAQIPGSQVFNGMECDDLTFQLSRIGSGSSPGRNEAALVNINRRIEFSRKADGSVVKGDLFGAGLKVTVWRTGDISVVEGRPVEVIKKSRREITALKSVPNTLAGFAEWTSTPGFNSVRFLQMQARPGYSALPMEAINDRAVAMAANHTEQTSRKVDEIPFPDPALPAPVLRPSYLFGPSTPLYPAEPVSLPADNSPNLKRIQISRSGTASGSVSLSAELTQSPLRADVIWKKYSLKTGVARPVGRGKVLQVKSPTNGLDFYLASVIVPEISTSPVVSIPVWVTPEPTMKAPADPVESFLAQIAADTSAANCGDKGQKQGALFEDELLRQYASDAVPQITAGKLLAQASNSVPLPTPVSNLRNYGPQAGAAQIDEWRISSLFGISVTDGRSAIIDKYGDMHKGLAVRNANGALNSARFGSVDVGPFQAGVRIRGVASAGRFLGNDLVTFQSAPCNWGANCGNLKAIPPDKAMGFINSTDSLGRIAYARRSASVSGDWIMLNSNFIDSRMFYKQYQMGLTSPIGVVHVATVFNVRNNIDGGPGIPAPTGGYLEVANWIGKYNFMEEYNRWLSLGKYRPGLEVRTVVKAVVDKCLLTQRSLTEFCTGASQSGGMRFDESPSVDPNTARAACQVGLQSLGAAKAISSEAGIQKNVSSLRMTVAGPTSAGLFLEEGGRWLGFTLGIETINGAPVENERLTSVMANQTILGSLGLLATNGGWTFRPLLTELAFTPTFAGSPNGVHSVHIKSYPANWTSTNDSTPGNIAVPGCASPEPYQRLKDKKFLWDDNPNCMHKHSQWRYSQNAWTPVPNFEYPLYMGDAARIDAGRRVWVISKEVNENNSTNFNSPLYNPAQQTPPLVTLCTQSSQFFEWMYRTSPPSSPDEPLEPQTIDGKEPHFNCAKAAFFEVQARDTDEQSSFSLFHGIPIFFSE